MKDKEQASLWISENQTLMKLLEITRDLKLNDGWVAAGTIRNFLWNQLFERADQGPETDIDVVYFDRTTSYEEALEIEAKLNQDYPDFDWEVRNQAFMHRHNFADAAPYLSTADAISKYPERCTAVALRLAPDDRLEWLAPYGLTDIFTGIVRPTPPFLANQATLEVYQRRQQKKHWQDKWPQLKIQKIAILD